MTTLAVSYDRYRPKACAFYAGRAWYAGIPSGEKLGWVMFSQVLVDINNIDKCYQQNDPTSEAFSDVLDSDGGVIQIPEAGEIVGLYPVAKALFVFASNGVWQIIGGDNGFTAAAYSVEKVSSVGCLFQKTIVPVEDNVLYWSNSGVYLLTTDGSTNTASVKNISDASIKTLYQDIPTMYKMYAQGKYNESDKIVQWLYNDSGVENTSNGPYKKNRVLCLDISLNSFYTYTVDIAQGPLVVGLAVTKETSEQSSLFDVYVGTSQVIDSVSHTIIADVPILGGNIKQYKYLTIEPTTTYQLSFADFSHSNFSDWYSYNNVGTELPSYVVTGYNMGGSGPARNKTGQYVSMFMKRTETSLDVNAQPVNPSGIYMQTRWDFTDRSDTKKWSEEVQVYRHRRPFWGEPSMSFDDGYPLVITKNKLRGRGKALQIKLSAEVGKDMQVVGWSMVFVGNTNV